jgi:hypothetical protein
LEASQQFSFYRVGLLAPRPTPVPEDLASVLFISLRGRVGQLCPWVPILVASYDTHGLRWDYSYSPFTTRGNIKITFVKYVVCVSCLLSQPDSYLPSLETNQYILYNSFSYDAEVMNGWRYASIPPHVFMAW